MSRARIGLALSVAAALAATAATPALAAPPTSATQSQVVQFTNMPAIQLSLGTTTPFSFGSVDPLTVYTQSNANTATVSSNAAWHLTVNGTGNFSDGSSPAQTIPDGRLTVTGQTAVTLGSTPATIATGGVTPSGGTAVPISYSLALQWNDPASSTAYADTLTYIATTP